MPWIIARQHPPHRLLLGRKEPGPERQEAALDVVAHCRFEYLSESQTSAFQHLLPYIEIVVRQSQILPFTEGRPQRNLNQLEAIIFHRRGWYIRQNGIVVDQEEIMGPADTLRAIAKPGSDAFADHEEVQRLFWHHGQVVGDPESTKSSINNEVGLVPATTRDQPVSATCHRSETRFECQRLLPCGLPASGIRLHHVRAEIVAKTVCSCHPCAPPLAWSIWTSWHTAGDPDTAPPVSEWAWGRSHLRRSGSVSLPEVESVCASSLRVRSSARNSGEGAGSAVDRTAFQSRRSRSLYLDLALGSVDGNFRLQLCLLRNGKRPSRPHRVQALKHVLTAMAAVCILLVVGLPASWAEAVAPTSVRPPSSIDHACGSDVSSAMTSWLSSLPPGALVDASRDCFLVNEGMSLTLSNITISGGTWKDDTRPSPSIPYPDINAVFWLVGGTDVMLENLNIQGVNGAPYSEGVAFQSGIRSDGVQSLTITNVTVQNLGGDGITLTGYDWSPYTPTTNAIVSNVIINDVGRQGVTLSDVNGARLSNIALSDIGLDTFDLESDNYGEVAENITINGCTASGGGIFFANAGEAGGSAFTGNIVVENCTMEQAQAGDAIFIQTPAGEGVRGPFVFRHDAFECGTSAYVGCVELMGGDVNIVDSSLTFPSNAEPQYRRVWDVYADSTVDFLNDVVAGYSAMTEGGGDSTGSYSVRGGTWMPWGKGVAPPRTPARSWVVAAQPPVSTPETPYVIALPLIALLASGGIVALQYRRRRAIPKTVGAT